MLLPYYLSRSILSPASKDKVFCFCLQIFAEGLVVDGLRVMLNKEPLFSNKGRLFSNNGSLI